MFSFQWNWVYNGMEFSMEFSSLWIWNHNIILCVYIVQSVRERASYHIYLNISTVHINHSKLVPVSAMSLVTFAWSNKNPNEWMRIELTTMQVTAAGWSCWNLQSTAGIITFDPMIFVKFMRFHVGASQTICIPRMQHTLKGGEVIRLRWAQWNTLLSHSHAE